MFRRSKTIILILMILITNLVLAVDPDLPPEFNELNKTASSFVNWFYLLVGIIASVLIAFSGFKLYNNKITWVEFGGEILKIVAISLCIILATWIFKK